MALTLVLHVNANNNLAAVENFCLYVNIQSDNAAISTRANDLRDYLFGAAEFYGLPVYDCILGETLQEPSIDIAVISVDRGFAVILRVMIDGEVILDGFLLTRLVVYSGLMVSAGTTTSFESVRDITQELFEDLVVDWRNATGN
jgi:hypothetical protein